MGKKKRSHRDSRSKSRSSSPRRRRNRDEKRSQRGSSSEAKDRISPERHRNKRRRYRSRSSSRERHTNRSPDRKSRRSRSRSPDRKSRRTRSRSPDRSRQRSSRDGSRDKSMGSQSIKESTKPEERDLSKEIQGYESMTPAERIKAKVKLMVEKSQPEPTYIPSPSQLASIESESFEPTVFTSTKAPLGKHQDSSDNGHSKPRLSGYTSTVVDVSEYAPTVVELPTSELGQPLDQQAHVLPDGSHSNKGTVIGREEQRKDKWLKKLQMLRQKHGPPNT